MSVQTLIQKPGIVHAIPLWAYVAAKDAYGERLVDADNTLAMVWEGSGYSAVGFGYPAVRNSSSSIYPDGDYTERSSPRYLVSGGLNGSINYDGSSMGCPLAGVYNGKPVWYAGTNSGAAYTYLFYSRNRQKWVIFNREPYAYTIEKLVDDGEGNYHVETEAYGDTWYESAELPSGLGAAAKVTFGCAGREAMQAEADGEDPPAGKDFYIDVSVWKSTTSSRANSVCGKYEPMAGSSATGSIKIGCWTWRYKGRRYACDNSESLQFFVDGVKVNTQVPGLLLVERDEGGGWYARFVNPYPSPEEDLELEYIPDGQAVPVQRDNPPTMTWYGYTAVGMAAFSTASPTGYMYQIARLR